MRRDEGTRTAEENVFERVGRLLVRAVGGILILAVAVLVGKGLGISEVGFARQWMSAIFQYTIQGLVEMGSL